MSTSAKTSYHHGNLRPALVQAGIQMLEAGDPFSLRAVARHMGVSQAAPYRHFPDKEHLEAAMATQGFTALYSLLEQEIASRGNSVQLVDLALVYTRYAMKNPALYRLMFSQACGKDDERLAAADRVFSLLEQTVENAFPESSPHGLATAGWALSHGLASLYLDGKFEADGEVGFEARVREAFAALSL